MHFEIFDKAEKGFFQITTYGPLSLQSLSEMLRELVSNPQWRKGLNLLMDHRKSSWVQAETDSLSSFSDIILSLDSEFGARQLAIVTPPEDGTSWSSMFKFLIESKINLKIKIFGYDDIAHATSWVDEN